MAERIDNIGFGDLKLIQEPSEFCYGVDAVILADFAAKHASGPVRQAVVWARERESYHSSFHGRRMPI